MSRCYHIRSSPAGCRSSAGDSDAAAAVDERGTASVWALMLTAGAFTALLGLVVDGGGVIEERLDASRIAGQAARDAADSLSHAAARSGGDRIAVHAATTSAHAYLRRADAQGTVRVAGDTVTVTVTSTSRNQILTVLGVDSFPVRETETAIALTQETP